MSGQEVIKTTKRAITGPAQFIAMALALLTSLFHLYTANFGVFEALKQRSAHLMFALALVFIYYSYSTSRHKYKVPWFDWVLAGLSFLAYGYIFMNSLHISSRLAWIAPLSTLELAIGIIGIVVLLEAARRVSGWPFTIIVGVFLLYGLTCQYWPGFFNHGGIRFTWLIEGLFYTTNGVFGVPTGISATLAAIFVLFGAFLEASGAGKWFIDFSIATMGKYRGGPAKAAVIASGLLGMVTGSATGNTVTTGVFTIPMMKKLGFKPHFAGAVEAVASTGGQFMPPIMGAAAFILAEISGIPYLKVATAAIVPAVLFYSCLIFAVHYESLKMGIGSAGGEDRAALIKTIARGFYFAFPLIAIVYALVVGVTPFKAGLYGVFFATLIGLLNSLLIEFSVKQLKDFLKSIFNALVQAARNMIPVAISCGGAGVVCGIVVQTGLGIKMSSAIFSLAGGNVWVILFLTMLLSIVLGMGVPTSAAYIIQVGITIPILIQAGLPVLASHLFVFFFSCLSFITPPVALAAFAGAALAEANPNQTGFTACKLGLSGFFIPFMFILNPGLLMQGTALDIILACVMSFITIFALASVLQGWLVLRTAILERAILAAATVLLFISLKTTILFIPGLLLLGMVVFMQLRRKKYTHTDTAAQL